jgi:hypothetical protein
MAERPPGHCDDDRAWQEFYAEYSGKDREDFGYGDLTDFALANAVFMASRHSLDLIHYQTAAKERIRWLSIKLAEALAERSAHAEEIGRLKGGKRAPVQGYSAGIPWDMHLRAYDAYCKKYGSQKALIEGGCRGGFGTQELDAFIPGWREELSECAALTARAEKAEAALTRLNAERDSWKWRAETECGLRRKFQAERAEVVGALRPFAATGAVLEAKPKDDACWAGQRPAPPITFGHLRRAAKVYDALAAAEAAEAGEGEGEPCTDCGGTGVTYQTERPCAYSPLPGQEGGKP